MKKKKIYSVLMATAMTLCLGVNPVHAEESGDKPYIVNPSFENEIDKNENQMYKAERVSEIKVNESTTIKPAEGSGNYFIKVGSLQPEGDKEPSLWSASQGKGSVNVIIHNVKPNTKYKVTMKYMRASDVLVSTGVLDIDNYYDKRNVVSPWQMTSTINKDGVGSKKSELYTWQQSELEITTGPRTNEIYAFAYTGDYSAGSSGMFCFDDVKIEEVRQETVKNTLVDYKVLSSFDFPATVPAIQSFDKTYETFNVNSENQIFSTDVFSKAKTTYLAEKMKEKGIIKNYTIKIVSNADNAEGIVVVRKPIAFNLPENAKNSQKDAYQIDITSDKVVVYSNYIEGIQNGTMTLLQAFTQRKVLPTGTVKDYTDQVIRGLQVDSGRRYYSIDWLKDEIEQMAYYKQNKLQLRLKDNEGIRYDSTVAAAMKDEDRYWTQEEINDLVAYAKTFNVEIIPEIDFPGHANLDCGTHPEWTIENCPKALDLTKDEVREYMISVYKEAIRFFNAKTIHIGGDEYFEGSMPKGEAGTKAREKLATWAKGVSGKDDANEYDALKIFFNEAYEELKKEFGDDLKILVWSDNIKNLDGAVPLNRGFVIDFWSGGIYGSIGVDKVPSEFEIMTSPGRNYHDLWPLAQRLDRPEPMKLFDSFSRYDYASGDSYTRLTKNLERAQGQMFPIWDDAHGYVPEYILSRTLFPRFGAYAYKTWGADYINSMNYHEFENLLFLLGSPSVDLFPQVKINYTKSNLDTIVTKIQTAVNSLKESGVSNDRILELENTIANIKADENGFYNTAVKNIISQYENISYNENGNTDQVDKTKLINKMQEINKINLNLYTDETVAKLNDAVTKAEAILLSNQVNQEDITTAINNVDKAIKGLVYKKADYSKLEKVKKNAELFAPYWEKGNEIEKLLEKVYSEAYDKEGNSILMSTHQNIVDSFEKELNDVLEKYVGEEMSIKVEIVEFVQMVEDNLNNIDITSFRAASIESICALITRTEKLITDINAKYKDLNNLYNEFNSFIWDDLSDYLALKDSIINLKDVVSVAEGILESANEDDYDSGVYWDLYDYLSDAKDLIRDEDDLSIWDKDDVYDAYISLEEALMNFKPNNFDESKIGNKEKLKEVYDLAKQKYVTLYTEETTKTFNETMELAKNVYYNPVATQEEINDIATKLKDAIDQLELKTADYTKVEVALNKVKALNKDDYVDFSAVEKAVNAVVRDLKITEQEKVDAMADAIEDAIAKLEKKPVKVVDKAGLEKMVKTAKEVDTSLYTQESLKVLKEAIQDAEKILAKEDVSEKDVKEAQEKLQSAIDNLVKINSIKPSNPEKPGNDTPLQPDKKPQVPVIKTDDIDNDVLEDRIDNSNKVSQDKSDKSTKTSDSTLLLPYIILSVCAAGTYITIKKKRI